MKYFLAVFFSVICSGNIFSQDLNNLFETAVKLEKKGSLEESLDEIKILKAHVDFKYYEMLKKNYYRKNIIDGEKSLILLIVNNMALINFQKTEYSYKAGELYLWATKQCIKDYEGDLVNLESINIHSDHKNELKHYLKPAIERAGGKWIELKNTDFGKPVLPMTDEEYNEAMKEHRKKQK